ncbi:hypothetical protein SEA_JINKIES_75 [Arthrobacter phage Jinkies]|uniref:Uncharacterized protein n=1 Tax=Arthrobacter phage Jinkies TaxID=2743903 RepID=A0A7T0IFJ4_9CAUD|nr:hypothetical protein SEA_JINKIES_75 [Arthrobacter phage Jinkies]
MSDQPAEIPVLEGQTSIDEVLHEREVIGVHAGYGEEVICAACLVHWPCPGAA